MISIGILKRKAVLTDVEKIFITVASFFGHSAYVFTIDNVDFEKRIITGKTLFRDTIIEKEFPFPNVIQNRLAMDYQHTKAYEQLADEIPFTTNRVGTKKIVFDKLSTSSRLKPYLIEVIDAKSNQAILNYLKQHQYIILKPLAGNQGKGIHTVKRIADNQYLVCHMGEKLSLSEEALTDYFKNNITQQRYTMSPFIVSETVHHLPCVFRIHLTRGAHGEWQMIKFFPYVTISPNSDITNGMQGALITTRESLFLEQNYPDKADVIERRVKHLASIFPSEFEKSYPYNFDALGLDIGINQDGNLYIYEVNAGPGVGFMAYPVAVAQVKYAEYLAEHAKPPFQYQFLPLLRA
jgi:hypothetical protein